MQAFVIDTYKGGLAQREMPDPSRDRATWSSQYPGDEREPARRKILDGELKFILPYRLPLILGITLLER